MAEPTKSEIISLIENLAAMTAKGFDESRIYMDRRFAEQRQYMDTRFEQVDERFKQIDLRFEQVDRRFEQIDAHFDAIDQTISRIEGKLDTQHTILGDHEYRLKRVEKASTAP